MVHARIAALSAAILPLLFVVAPVHAQVAESDTTTEAPPSDRQNGRVRVTLLSSSESPPGAPQLPLSMIRHLIGEEHIQEFSVDTNRARTEFSVELVFEDAERLRAWYESESAQRIIEALNERDDLTSLSMRVRRI